MREFVIFGDSTCDLSKEMRESLDIDYVAMNYVIDGTEYPASLDWEGMSVKEFYDTMRGGKRITTTQVPQDVFEKRFAEVLEQGKDILYISCSSALSGSINMGNIVANELREKYPEATIKCIDSLNASFGQGVQLLKAAQLRAEGKTIEEVAQYIEDNKLKVHQVAFPANLSYLKKAGRVTASSAFFGNIIGIKPILISDAIGQNYALKKAKGEKAAIEEAANMIAEEIVNPEEQIVYISHADAEETVNKLKELLLSKVKVKDVVYGYIGPIVGASVGPGTIAAYYVGETVTFVGKA